MDKKQQLEKLRDMLPTGGITLLAKKFGVSSGTIKNALNGLHGHYDSDIINAAIELVRNTIDAREAAQKNLEDMLKELS